MRKILYLLAVVFMAATLGICFGCGGSGGSGSSSSSSSSSGTVSGSVD